jgi:hypothetical protein
MLEPRNEGGAVLRERRRLQLPKAKRLHQHPAACADPASGAHGTPVRLSLFTSRHFTYAHAIAQTSKAKSGGKHSIWYSSV